MKKIIGLLALSFFTTSLCATDYEYKFRLNLKDKGDTNFSIDRPDEFLSQKALDRRSRQNIDIKENDLPISEAYLAAIEKAGGIVVAKSKWNKTVAVHCKDSAMIEKLKGLDFVEDVKLVWRGAPKSEAPTMDTMERYPMMDDQNLVNYYGLAYDNIKMLKGDTLHNRGYRGMGMTIAVIDAGFNNYPKIDFLDNINIAGYKNFVYDNHTLFKQKNQHGTNVISCIATNKPHLYVGTAPEADFWMLGTEDSESEFPIEEDYWAEAIEYADSVGVDVVNTSLGYTKFDVPAESFTTANLDGKSALISRAASIAARKGLFIVVSAGNSGNGPWGKISAPADAYGVLTVGSVMRDSVISSFSSRGLTADLRVKPDVVALGSSSAVINDEGAVAMKSGTSFSSPIMCGIVACLWQAFPTLTNYELLDVIRESANRYEDPSISYGFGIPDMEKAMQIGQMAVDRKEIIRNRRK